MKIHLTTAIFLCISTIFQAQTLTKSDIPDTLASSKNVVVTSKGVEKVDAVLITDDAEMNFDENILHSVFEMELMKDKLILDRKFVVELTESSFLVNGKTVDKLYLDKYATMYRHYSGNRKCPKCKFKLKMDMKNAADLQRGF